MNFESFKSNFKSFKSSCFFYMTKKSRQKFKYLENEKSFYAEIKINFRHFRRAFIEATEPFFRRWEPDFNVKTYWESSKNKDGISIFWDCFVFILTYYQPTTRCTIILLCHDYTCDVKLDAIILWYTSLV